MKRFLLIAVTILMVAGCAQITPVKHLGLPPVTTIEGIVTAMDKSGFTIKDGSGSIRVRAELPDKPLNLTVDEKVRVYGNLQGGERVFDGYVIRRSNGEQIIITNPTPHLGFIIQSRFR